MATKYVYDWEIVGSPSFGEMVFQEAVKTGVVFEYTNVTCSDVSPDFLADIRARALVVRCDNEAQVLQIVFADELAMDAFTKDWNLVHSTEFVPVFNFS